VSIRCNDGQTANERWIVLSQPFVLWRARHREIALYYWIKFDSR